MSLLQLEQQGAGGHVFQLPRRIAPIPVGRQLDTDPAATPIRMRVQKLKHVGQFRGTNLPALNDDTIRHAPNYGKAGA